jgi:hypothetical protein
MVAGQGTPNDDVRPDPETHEEFLKLCALSISSNLTDEERKRLREHLAVCPGCREAKKEFEAVVDHVIPGLAPELARETPAENPSFSTDAAENAFFKRLSEEDKKSRNHLAATEPWLSPLVIRQSRNFRRRFQRYYLWLPMAACIMLCTAFGIVAYRSGIYRGVAVGKLLEAKSSFVPASFETALEEAGRDRDAANAQLAGRNKAIAELEREIARQRSENEELKETASGQQVALRTKSEEQKRLGEDRDAALQQAAADKAALEAKLENLERQRSEDVTRAASLDAEVAELSRSLQVQEQSKTEEDELLAKDRDIRELMGARDRTMSPLIRPGTYVQIDAKQTHIKDEPAPKGSGPFARPVYFLDIRTGYACGWCQIEDGILTLIPHPDSGVKARSFRHPSEVEVVGRVIEIHMCIDEERQAKIEEPMGRKNPPQK